MVDYTYYTDVFKGTLVPLNSFEQSIRYAYEYLNYKLAKGYDTEDEDVKKCACALCEVFYSLDNEGGLASQSTGSWSISYSTYKTNPKLNYTLESYLKGKGLLVAWL